MEDERQGLEITMKGVEDSSTAAQAILYEGGNGDLMKQVMMMIDNPNPDPDPNPNPPALALTLPQTLTLPLPLPLPLPLTLGHDDDG